MLSGLQRDAYRTLELHERSAFQNGAARNPQESLDFGLE